MQRTLPAKETLSIKRHCMQQLLHHALTSPHTSGLLAGRKSTIEAIFPVTENMFRISESDQPDIGPLTLLGIYQATDDAGNISPEQTNQLSGYFRKHCGKMPGCHLLLALGTEGRLDALMFADPEHSIPIPLDMQEDECSVPNCPE